jgi:hypothetical protein
MPSNAVLRVFGHTVSSAELLLAAAVLLGIAALLLLFTRQQKIALQRSWVADEFILHLSRIADALERQASRPIQPTVAEASKEPAPPAQTKIVDEVHTMPYSMLGRELSQNR